MSLVLDYFMGLKRIREKYTYGGIVFLLFTRFKYRNDFTAIPGAP
jgi:hypothetical protein